MRQSPAVVLDILRRREQMSDAIHREAGVSLVREQSPGQSRSPSIEFTCNSGSSHMNPARPDLSRPRISEAVDRVRLGFLVRQTPESGKRRESAPVTRNDANGGGIREDRHFPAVRPYKLIGWRLSLHFCRDSLAARLHTQSLVAIISPTLAFLIVRLPCPLNHTFRRRAIRLFCEVK